MVLQFTKMRMGIFTLSALLNTLKKMPVNGYKSTKVYAVPPDKNEYGTVIMYETSRVEDLMEFSVPVDTYTWVVIQQQAVE